MPVVDTEVRRARLGLLAVACAALTWSLGAIGAGALLQRGVDPLLLAEARVVLAALGFAAVAVAVTRQEPGPRVPALHLLAFGTAIALVAVAFFLAIGRLGVAVGTVLHYMAPVLVVVWGVASSRRRPTPLVLRCTVAAVVGVVLVSGALEADLGGIDGWGVVIGLFSATCFATYTLLAERVIVAVGPLQALLRGFGIASVLWLVFQAFRGWPAALFAPANIGLVLFVGLVGTCLPFLLYIWGIQRVQAERAAIAATLEPVISAVVAWVILDQVLTALQIAGGAVILAAVIALQARGAVREIPAIELG